MRMYIEHTQTHVCTHVSHSTNACYYYIIIIIIIEHRRRRATDNFNLIALTALTIRQDWIWICILYITLWMQYEYEYVIWVFDKVADMRDCITAS